MAQRSHRNHAVPKWCHEKMMGIFMCAAMVLLLKTDFSISVINHYSIAGLPVRWCADNLLFDSNKSNVSNLDHSDALA